MMENYDKEFWEDKKCPKYDCRKNACKCGLKKVYIPTALGDDSASSSVAPKNGAYCDAIVVYEANKHVYIYSKDGVPTLVDSGNGDYYTKGQVDTLLASKQDELTAGSNITISGNTISATDTTYNNFVGTDGVDDGTAGLVPAPATTDVGKFLKSDGTWDIAGGGGPTVVQTTGTSQTDVMSQNAVTERVYPRFGVYNDAIGIVGANESQDSSAGALSVGIGSGHIARGDSAVVIGAQATVYAAGLYSIAIGNTSKTEGHTRAVAVGNATNAAFDNSVAIGTNAKTTRVGEVNVGADTSGRGYNSTNYRVIGGVHDGVDAHDAVNLSQLNGRVLQNAGAPTTSTVGTVGQLLEDTTNGNLYQCTAIVPGTDPDPDTYTWREIANIEQLSWRQRKPVVVWEVDGAVVTTGLVGVGEDISANPNWQLTGLDLTPYKRIKIFTRCAQKAGATASASTTPAMVLEMSLDPRAAIAEYGGNYVGSILAQKPNDANRLCTLTCAVSADKSKFEVLRMTSLYGTVVTSNSDVNAYVFKIEGYYD